MKVTYNSNNSGGSWWLTDEDWKALEAAGWEVRWVKGQPRAFGGGQYGERWLGALAMDAVLECDSIASAIASFEKVTGNSVADEGCPCCGPPHSFYEVRD